MAEITAEKKLVIFSGGGTGGSVSPLLSVIDELRARNSPYSYAWVGTRHGIEREMVAKTGLDYLAISGGKLRRYFSIQNLADGFRITAGFLQSVHIIARFKPRLVMSAGSFISVPLVFAAWLFRVPAVIHQQDACPGLANKLMAPFSKVVTVTFRDSLRDFGSKAVWTGNPIRRSLTVPGHKSQAISQLELNNGLPIILVLGGGTGAMAINELVWQSLGELIEFCRIIHITGKNKFPDSRFPIPDSRFPIPDSRYIFFDFLDVDGMASAFSAADLVVSRCGMGVLSELSQLGKPSILIPIPGTHQEQNAEIFQNAQAAIVLRQEKLDKAAFVRSIRRLLADKDEQRKLSKNIKLVIKPGAAAAISDIIARLI